MDTWNSRILGKHSISCKTVHSGYRSLGRDTLISLETNGKSEEGRTLFEHRLGNNIVPFTFSACRLFPLGFLARNRFFNGHGMSCVGTPVLWDSKQLGSMSIYLQQLVLSTRSYLSFYETRFQSKGTYRMRVQSRTTAFENGK